MNKSRTSSPEEVAWQGWVEGDNNMAEKECSLFGEGSQEQSSVQDHRGAGRLFGWEWGDRKRTHFMGEGA